MLQGLLIGIWMNRKMKPRSIIVFGSSGFVGMSLLKNSTRMLICPIRVNGEWILDQKDLDAVDEIVDVIIAVGPARFSSSNSEDHDRDIVSKIHKFLKSMEFQIGKVVYISSLAALESHPKNSYGISKVQAEEFIKSTFTNVTVFRPPALFGNGMSNESHLNWFLSKRKLFYLFSKFTNSGISFLHVDDFAKIVYDEIEASRSTNEVIYPRSTAIHFKDLALLINRKKVKRFREVREPRFSPMASMMPFKLQPLFIPIWVDKSQIGLESHLDLARKLENHVMRYNGFPTSTAPVIVVGGDGGLGRAICSVLNEHGFEFICVDRNPTVNPKKWEYCREYWRIDLTNDLDLEDFYVKMDSLEDVSWIVTAAGRGLRGDINDFDRVERLNFWKLMVLSRIDIVGWAQKRSPKQERIGVINVSSSSAYFPLPNYADYSSANNSLRMIGRVGSIGFPKLILKTVVPGGMKTELMKDYGNLEKFHAGAMEPEYVARKIVDMMCRDSKREAPIGLNSKVLYFLQRPNFYGTLQLLINFISKRVR